MVIVMAKTKIIEHELNPFALRLRELISKNKTTQQKVAEGIGVTRQALNKWVNGETVPDALVASRLAKHFDVSVDYMVGNAPIRSTNANVRTAFENLGITEEAIEHILRLFDKNDKYGDMTEFINLFFARLDKEVFYSFAQKVRNMSKTEIFKQELYKKYMKDYGFEFPEEDSEDIVEEYYYYQGTISNDSTQRLILFKYFENNYFDIMLEAYRTIDSDLLSKKDEENEVRDIANSIKEVIEGAASDYFDNEEMNSALSEDEQKYWRKFYKELVSTELNTKKFNNYLIDSFYKKYALLDEAEKNRRKRYEHIFEKIKREMEDNDDNFPKKE